MKAEVDVLGYGFCGRKATLQLSPTDFMFDSTTTLTVGGVVDDDGNAEFLESGLLGWVEDAQLCLCGAQRVLGAQALKLDHRQALKSPPPPSASSSSSSSSSSLPSSL